MTGVRRWVVLEPTLAAWIGHQRALIEALPALARERGVEVAIFGSTLTPADLTVGDDAVTRLFRLPPLPSWAATPGGSALARFVLSAPDVVADLESAAGPRLGADDLVVLPTAYPWLMLGLSTRLRREPASRRPRVAAVLHEAPGMLAGDGGAPSLDEAMVSLGLSALASVVVPDRLVLAATTIELARALRRHVDRPIGIVPVANAVERFAARASADRRATGGRAPLVAFPGIPRTGKRVNLLDDVVAAVRDRMPDVRLLVQVPQSGSRHREDDRLQLHVGALPDAAYVETLTGAAIVVLPYDPAQYRGRVSGMFVESAAAGCVLVVPPGTWMAERIADGRAAGIVAEDQSPEGYASAVAAAHDGLAALGSRAMALSARWRAEHGPRPFMERIEALVAGLPARIALR